jgi:acid stress-induced BolA-like protein IbaG/YrbA
MLQAIEIQKIIESNLKCDYIKVTGDDGTHFEAVIVSDAFTNQSMIKQHQQVYSALGNMMQKEIHALSIKTFTPDDWNQIK